MKKFCPFTGTNNYCDKQCALAIETTEIENGKLTPGIIKCAILFMALWTEQRNISAIMGPKDGE